MSKTGITSKERVTYATIRPVKVDGNKDIVINHSIGFRPEQWEIIVDYASRNQLMGYEPNSASQVVRAAVDLYFLSLAPEIRAEFGLPDLEQN